MSNKIRCLIVDDEPIARQILETYCGHLPKLELVGISKNAFEAKETLQNILVDLIFLDINMPVLDGRAFVKTLKNPPQIIFTTAYKEFAHEAFDLAAIDYLLKPFSLERFIVAVDKAEDKLNQNKSHLQLLTEKKEEYTFVKYDEKIHKINFDELLYVEAKGNSTHLITSKIILKPTYTFTAIELLLPKQKFLRLHRSFIVNKSKIRLIEGNRVFIGDIEIPIGASYRENFLIELGL